MRLSVVIPTYGRQAKLGRVLDALAGQASGFEVIVVADAVEDDPAAVDAAIGERPYPARRVDREARGVSSARNAGWRAAAAPLVMFLDDDVVPDPGTLEQHLEWHARHPEEAVGVLGDVRWARELRVTPFMRWLERGIQFDYRGIAGDEAGWGRFYTANVSVKRALLERVGGFDEGLPWGYEDLDIAMRMHDEHGFRLLYNRDAGAQHLHEMTLESWRKRAAVVARAEKLFVAKHPDFPPYYHQLFSAAAAQQQARGRGAKLARWVPERVPWLGPRVWGAADLYWRQQLAVPFLAAWAEA